MADNHTRSISNQYNPKGIQNSFSSQTSFGINSTDRLNSNKSNEVECHDRSSGQPSTERSLRSSNRPISGVLLQVLPDTQEELSKVQSNSGPILSEYLHSQREVQDGHSRIHQRSSSTGRLDNFNRSVRCISPYSYSSLSQEIPKIQIQRNNLPIQSTGNGSHNLTQSLHKNKCGCSPISSATRCTYAPISGRLVDLSSQSTNSPCTYTSSVICSVPPRVDCKYGKVGLSSETNIPTSVVSVLPGTGQSSSHGRKMGENSNENSPISGTSNIYSTKMAISSGPSCSYREIGSTRNASRKTIPTRSTKSVVSTEGTSIRHTSDLSDSPSSSCVVDSQTKCDGRSSSKASKTNTRDLHRCKPDRVRRNSERSGSVREVERDRETVAYQCSGTTGNLEGSQTFPESNPRIIDPGCFGQHHCCCLHQQAGWNPFHVPYAVDRRSASLVRCTSNHCNREAHTRQTECFGRCSVETQANNTNRMVDPSKDSSLTMGDLGKTTCRHVCHTPQSQTTNICLSCTRPHGIQCKCHEHGLGQHVCVCLSSDSNSQSSTAENQTTQLQSHSDSTILAQTSLVSSHTEQPDRSSKEDSSLGSSAKTAQNKHLSRQSSTNESSRLAIVKQAHRNRGFSDKVANRMAEAQKISTLKVYEGKWRVYCNWCEERNFDPLQTSSIELSEFLLHLHENVELATTTIEGYRSAISNTIKAVKEDVDLGKDISLTSLISNFNRDKNKKKTRIPPWNLSLVLRKLNQAPFEPIKDATLKFLTFKTVFLLALVTGKRRSELHAMKSDIYFSEGWSSVTIVPDPNFIAKITREGVQFSECG